MSEQPEFLMTEKEAEDIAVRLLSTRMMRAIEKVVGGRRKEIAKNLGVSPSYVSQLFSGDKILNLPKLHKIQKAYQLQADVTFRAIQTMRSVSNQGNIENIQRPPVEHVMPSSRDLRDVLTQAKAKASAADMQVVWTAA